jgi:hypothetical protein
MDNYYKVKKDLRMKNVIGIILALILPAGFAVILGKILGVALAIALIVMFVTFIINFFDLMNGKF